MIRWQVFGGLALLVVAAPYLVLLAAGLAWLSERGSILVWLAAAAASSLTASAIYYVLARRHQALPWWNVEPAPIDSPADQRAWAEVQQLAERAGERPLTLDHVDVIRQTLLSVLEAVARQHHPHVREPLLEVSVPDALAVVELVAHDLRALAETLPASHLLTIGQIRQLQSTGTWGLAGLQIGYNLYRVARLIYNPAGSLLGEASRLGTRKTWDWLRADFQCRAQSYAVQLAGKYAIELYSGRIQLRQAEVRQYVTVATQRDEAQAEARQRQVAGERLRVLVLGQVKAGKSSLINALFGEVRAAVGTVPCTRSVEPYLLARDDADEAIILDTAGYQDVASAPQLVDDLRAEALQADLILLVVAANSAARAADRAIWEAIEQAYAEQPHRRLPPCLVALTHIDLLRPMHEWSPPYDLGSDAPKARSIRDALAAVTDDLQIPPERIAPVCLLPGRLYNVHEALMPLLVQMFPEAERSRAIRVLAMYHDETRWRGLWQQALRSGRLALSTLGQLYGKPQA